MPAVDKPIRVRKTFNECYECVSHSRDHKGYVRIQHNGSRMSLTRIIYTGIHGPIPEGLIVRHTCDNPPCCNPQHLILGTEQDNANDRRDRGRTAIGERASKAKLKEQQVVEILALKGTGISGLKVAKQFKVGRSTIYGIWNGEYWKHLQ